MEVVAIGERTKRIAAVRADRAADPGSIRAALRAVSELRSWLAASEADLTSQLAAQVSFPEQAVADCTRSSLRDAAKAKERAATLAAMPSFGTALDAGEVTAGHVDAVTRAGSGLDADQRAALFERVVGLVDMATTASVREFRDRLAREVKNIERERHGASRTPAASDPDAHLDRR